MDKTPLPAPNKVDIVMFNMSEYRDWQNGIVNRNCHVLHHLLKDERVRKIVAVDYLPFTRKRAARELAQDVVAGVGGKVIARGLTHKLVAVRESELERTGYSLPGFEPSSVPYKLFVYSDVGSVRNEPAVYRRLARELKRIDVKNVVLWSYLPSMVGYFGQFGEGVSVFDAVDSWLEHASYVKLRSRLQLNYQTIRHQADVIFTTSPDLVKFFDRPNCSFVPNGISAEQIAGASRLVGRDLVNIPRPIIGYGGTLQENRLDMDLLAYLARANPTKSFVLIGPVWPGARKAVERKLRPLHNVYLLGRKPYREALSYYREFKVALIPHQVNEFNRQTNPLKLYDYLALGRPVVATKGVGLDDFGDVVHLAATPEEFNQALLKALNETSEAEVAKRQERVRAYSWDVLTRGMLDQVLAAWHKPA